MSDRILPIEETPFKNYKAQDFAMWFIEQYGGIDGGHHKTWVLDQVARCLKGTPVIIKEYSWEGNEEKEWRINTGEPSKEYLDWVKEMKGKYDDVEDEYEYSYDEGIAP